MYSMSFWDKASQIASSGLKTIRLTGNNEEQNVIKTENEELKIENEKLKSELNNLNIKYKQLLDDITIKQTPIQTDNNNPSSNNDSNIYQQMFNNILYNYQQFLLTLFNDNDSIIEKIKKDFFSLESSSDPSSLTSFFNSFASLIQPKILFNFHAQCKSKYELFLSQDILNKVNSYDNYFTDSQNAIKISNEVIDSFLSLIETQTKDISIKDEKLEKYEEKFTSLNESISKMQSDCRRASTVEQNMEEIISNIQNEKNEIKVLLDNANKEISNLQKENEVLVKGKTEFETILSKSKEDIVKEQLLKEELIQNIKEYQNENEKLKNDIKQLEKDIELYTVNNESLNEKNAQICNKIEQIEKMETSYKFLEDTYLKYQKDKNEEINLYKAQILDLSNQLTEKKQIDNIEIETENIEKGYIDKIENLQNQIEVLEKENNVYKEKEKQMKEKMSDLIKKVENDLKDTEYMIDKRVISSVLVSYFDKNTSAKVKESLLETLSGFMEYSNEDRKKMGLKPITVPMSSNTAHNNDKLKTLSDGLYDFILNS